MIPAMYAPQLSWPRSLGTDTKVFVTGSLSWIMSAEPTAEHSTVKGMSSTLRYGPGTERKLRSISRLHSSSFMVLLSRESAVLPNSVFQTVDETNCQTSVTICRLANRPEDKVMHPPSGSRPLSFRA
jgi:hypothetical protein